MAGNMFIPPGELISFALPDGENCIPHVLMHHLGSWKLWAKYKAYRNDINLSTSKGGS